MRISGERKEPGSISGRLGNWFLIKGLDDKTIAKFPQAPKQRVEEMLIHANTSLMVEFLDTVKKGLDDKKRPGPQRTSERETQIY